MENSSNGEQFREIVHEHAILIDESLTEVGLPVHERPFRAAILFADVAVMDSSFGSGESLIKSDAFTKRIVPLFYDWYRERYGQLVDPRQKNLAGIAHFRSQPVELSFPATTSEIEEECKTAWIIYPDHMQAEESVHDFLIPTVDIDALDEKAREALEAEVAAVVKHTRRIRLGLMTASGLDSSTQSMAAGIWPHIAKAVADILTLEASSAAVGCWELHLAIEKSYKVYIGVLGPNRRKSALV